MTPREQPDYVGTEEDPMCVICQQLLYLSAVSCNCRPLAFVCLEHWEHLCECKPDKHRLLYRYTLSELSDLLLKADEHHSIEAADDIQRELCSEKAVALSKKVKGGQVTHVQLAEEWILKSCKILEDRYNRDAYASVIQEAQQFLWAGSEMDLVRNIESKLVQARDWAETVIDCFSKVKRWSNKRKCDTERVNMANLNELLSLQNVPCDEPSYLQLKEYHEEASKLIEQINSALSPSSESSVAEWEILYSKVVGSPIEVKESEKLKHKILAVKVCMESLKTCIAQETASSVEVDMLYKLESEILELQFKCHEADLLTDLISQVETCRSQCNVILKDPTSLKEVQVFLGEWEDLTVNIPELKLLRKYYSDAISWISRVNDILVNAHERDDQENVVDELMCIQRDGSFLQIQVDELPHLELELEKSRCRVKAFKALSGNISMDFIQQMISEATILHIEKEKIFTDVLGKLTVAMGWEEKAKHVLASEAPMTDFEDVLRSSDGISIILPSFVNVNDAVSIAKDWLIKSKPFLSCDSSIRPAADSCLKPDVLKELVMESKHLKVYLEECSLLEKVLNKCVKWEQDASSLLQDVEHLLSIGIVGDGNMNRFIPEFERQILSMESVMEVGISIGLEFNMIPKLQDSCFLLKWCIKALSFSGFIPTHKEVEIMLDDAASLSVIYKTSVLLVTLINGFNWLKKATEILDSHCRGRFEVSSVEEVLVQSKKISISYPMVIDCLNDAILNHNLWLDQVHLFFRQGSGDRSWNSLMQLKEHGNIEAFGCEELKRVLSEVEKVQYWKQRCENIIKPSSAEENPLLSALAKIKSNLERSIDLYSNHNNDKVRSSCTCCSNTFEDQKVMICSICKDSFHLQCTKQLFEDAILFVCPYCDFMKSSKLPRSGIGFLRVQRAYIELDMLVVLSSDANDLCLWTAERRMLQQIVEKACQYNASFKELVDFALAFLSKDLNVVMRKMCIALKAMDIAGVCDGEMNQNFELALARNSWKIEAEKLLGITEKPTIQKIRHHLKAGLAINIPPEDYFSRRLMEIRDMGLQWADRANKISVDGGVLGLDKVFELILEGENLPVFCEKELKLLRDRSMLYCLCRRPYDRRAMIACDNCDEWYHFDCVSIASAPKIYICPACNPDEDICASSAIPTTKERFSSNKFEEPHTPLRRNSSQKAKYVEYINNNDINNFTASNNYESLLLWRNRKTFRRVTRKRSEVKSLSPFFSCTR